jgi:acyl transferase domain-containing protein/surfactin synthase thioesterase subunit/NAD(P)-dependent dehydrogenase (short-subunit alcohol dehydrogenase family)/acyl carrier protein
MGNQSSKGSDSSESRCLHYDDKPGQIAIIGIGCRFPKGVNDVAAFWDMLATAADCTVPTPQDRFDTAYFYHPAAKALGKMYNRCGGYLDEPVYDFDRKFFRMPPSEAAHLDPQVRLLLEVAWEALEDAGLPAEHLKGSNTGVYTGVTSGEYQTNMTMPATDMNPYTNSGTNSCMIANRVSYEFDLKGPSFSIDTACSSSLYAIHLACEALRHGNCDLALAGGVNLLLHPFTSIGFCQAQMLSADGKCKSFDARADGYSRSEGAGMIVLKPLAAALADRDPIYAVVRGGALSNDGKTLGIAQPSYDAQVSLVDRAYKNAGVSPQQVMVIEAHGTGTKAGDRTEANALGQAMGRCRESKQPPLYIGSVKSNMGHTEGAAGVAGAIKAALMLCHRKIAPVAHFQTPNPEIKFDALRLKVPTALVQWPMDSKFGFAGCSSFGFGGANAHIVLQRSPVGRITRRLPSQDQPQNASDTIPANCPPQLLVISAASPAALQQHAKNWISFLSQVPANANKRFQNILFSASVRSQHHSHRLALVVRNPRDAQQQLQDFVEGKGQGKTMSTGVVTDTDVSPSLAFVFSGMGTQWWAMARQLLTDQQTSFSDKIKEIDRLLKQCGARWSLYDVLMSSQNDSPVDQTEIAQPAIFAVEVALVYLLRAVGISPSVVVGHSVGEVAAAHIAGALSLEEAVRVIYNRGKQLSKTGGQGTMLAVLSSRDNVERHLPPRQTTATDESQAEYEAIDVAAVNSPNQIVLSGKKEALDAVADSLAKEGTKAVFLRVNNAFHSYQQAPLKNSIMSKLSTLKQTEDTGPAIPMMSTVVADYVTPDKVATAGYWWSNIRGQVKFQESIERLLDEGWTHFIEIGAHSALTPAVKDIMAVKGMSSRAVILPTMKRPRDVAQLADDKENLLKSLGELYVRGVCFDFSALYPHDKHSFTPLPLYAWQREKCWVCGEGQTKRLFPVTDHLLLGEHQPSFTAMIDPQLDSSRTMTWKCKYSTATVPWLVDHVIQDSVIVPAAAYIETFYQAAKTIAQTTALRLKDLKFEQFMFANEGNASVVTVAKRESPSTFSTRIFTQDAAGSWQRHSEGTAELMSQEIDKPQAFNVEEVKGRCTNYMDHDDFYGLMNSTLPSEGFCLGPSFTNVVYTLFNADRSESLAFVDASSEIKEELHRFNFHPALMDSILQAFAVTIVEMKKTRAGQDVNFVEVPKSVGSMELYGRVPAQLWVHLETSKSTEDGDDIRLSGTVTAIDAKTKQVVCRLKDIRFTSISHNDEGKPHFWFLGWKHVMNMSLTDGKPKADKKFAIIETGDVMGRQLLKQINDQGYSCQMFDMKTLQSFPNVVQQSDVSQILMQARISTDIVITLADQYSVNKQAHTDPITTLTKSSFEKTQRRSAMVLLYTIQHLMKQDGHSNPNVWIVTKGANPMSANDPVDPLMSGIAGVSLTIIHEHPDIPVTLVDLPLSAKDDICAKAVISYVINPSLDENEVKLVPSADNRNVVVYAARLSETAEVDMSGNKPDTKWTMQAGSRSKGYVMKAGNRVIDEQCKTDHVVIKIESFVPIPVSNGTSGSKKVAAWFSGIITKCGSQVKTLSKGCCVTGLCSQVGSYIHMPATKVIPKPSRLSHNEAVGIARDLLSPWRSFVMGSKCSPGDAAIVYVDDASYYPFAACHVATCLGAKVVAVVEDDIDKSKLPPNCLHVRRCEVEKLTKDMKAQFGKEEADILFLGYSPMEDNKDLVKILKPFGSVIVYSTAEVGSLSNVSDSLQIIHVDPSSVALDGEPKREVTHAFGEFMKSIEQSKNGWTSVNDLPLSITALQPGNESRGLPLSESDPTYYIDGPVVASLPSDPEAFGVSPNETYLVTGGLKGFGLAVVEWLVDRGATSMVVLGRSAPSKEVKLTLDRLRKKSEVTIKVLQVDVTEEKQVDAAFTEIQQRMPPLAGIFHCAAVYADDWLSKLNEYEFLRVLSPKAFGAILLHQQTVKRNIQLKYFVLFSSAVSLFGNSGQGNYCAANTILNGLARYRQQHGLAATAVQYGPIGEVGFLAENSQLMSQWQQKGMAEIDCKRALQTLGKVLCLDSTQVGIQCHSSVGISAFAAPWITADDNTRFSRIKSFSSRPTDTTSGNRQKSALSKAVPRNDRLELVTKTTLEWLESKFGAGAIGTDSALVSVGLDSILASELSNALLSSFKVVIPPVRLLNDQCTAVSLAETVVKAAEQLDKTSVDDTVDGPDQSTAEKIGSRWVAVVNQPETIEMKLVCIPPNAGGVQSFANWDTMLQLHNVQLLVLQPPGWLGREREPCLNDMKEIVDQATQAILEHVRDVPFAMYGHSMGSLVAYEVACRLQDEHGLSPRHLMVAAFYAPHLPYPHPQDFNTPTAVFHPSTPWDTVLKHISQFKFIQKSPEVFRDKDPWAVSRFRSFVLPCVEAGLYICKRYAGDRRRLGCGITAFSGKHDVFAEWAEVEAWRQHAINDEEFKHVTVPADHYFMRSHYRDILTVLLTLNSAGPSVSTRAA